MRFEYAAVIFSVFFNEVLQMFRVNDLSRGLGVARLGVQTDRRVRNPILATLQRMTDLES